MRFPSGLKAAEYTNPSWPRRTAISLERVCLSRAEHLRRRTPPPRRARATRPPALSLPLPCDPTRPRGALRPSFWRPGHSAPNRPCGPRAMVANAPASLTISSISRIWLRNSIMGVGAHRDAARISVAICDLTQHIEGALFPDVEGNDARLSVILTGDELKLVGASGATDAAEVRNCLDWRRPLSSPRRIFSGGWIAGCPHVPSSSGAPGGQVL
jgi:hypothetical protein